jgi:hypothetical protein
MKKIILITIIFIIPFIINSNPRCNFDFSKMQRVHPQDIKEKNATIYLHWQLQRTKLLNQEELSSNFGTELGKSFKLNKKNIALTALSKYKNVFIQSMQNIEQTKTIEEFVPLYKMLYSYYCITIGFIERMEAAVSNSSNMENAKDKILKLIKLNSSQDQNEMQNIGNELKRLDIKYGISTWK